MVFHTFQYSVIVHCLCFPNWSGRQIDYTNIEEIIQYSSFCNLVFINEICLVSLRKCAETKIALSVQIEKCANYLQCQYIPIYSISSCCNWLSYKKNSFHCETVKKSSFIHILLVFQFSSMFPMYILLSQ